MKSLCAVLLFVSTPAFAQTWNAAEDWNSTSNPAEGPWVFGSENANGKFTPFRRHTVVTGGVGNWDRANTEARVRCHPTGVYREFGGVAYSNGRLVMRPGDSRADKYAVTRWVAPADGIYMIYANFEPARKTQAASATVQVKVDGAEVQWSPIEGLLNESPDPEKVFYEYEGHALLAGETIEFLVGPEAGGEPFDNATDDIALDVRIELDTDMDGFSDEEDDCPYAVYCLEDLERGQVVVTEIMYDPTVGPDDENEWFELYNPYESSVNLRGVRIEDESGNSYTIADDVVVEGESFAVLSLGDLSLFDYSFDVEGAYEGVGLSNTTYERLIVRTDTDILDTTAAFRDPTDAGVSWQLDQSSVENYEADEENNTSSVWCATSAASPIFPTDFGTPGEPNEYCP